MQQLFGVETPRSGRRLIFWVPSWKAESKDWQLLVDVGDVYNEATQRFDHHQRGFAETLDENHSIKLSSAGLIYKYKTPIKISSSYLFRHFGREVIMNMAPISPAQLEVIYYRLYKNFVEALDAIDNGVNQFDKTEPAVCFILLCWWLR